MENDINKAIESINSLEPYVIDISKAGGGKKDISKLQKKVITNKKNQRQTVYVKNGEDEKEPKKKTVTNPTRLGRYKELYGINTGDSVSVHYKGSEVSGNVQYWNVNKSTPKGYCVITLEDGTKIEKSPSKIHAVNGETRNSHQVSAKVGRVLQAEADHIESMQNATDGQKDAAQESISDIDVNEKFAIFSRMVKAVGSGLQKSLISYGSGGVGKTYTVTSTLAAQGKVAFDEDLHEIGGEGYDYIEMTGKVTPAQLYVTLHEHNNKLVIFDDCDSVLLDQDAQNVLKGALDTTGDGTINWKSSAKVKDSEGNEVPKRFKFGGSAIFISNLPPQKVPQALKSRSLKIDMTMTPAQTIDRIAHILDYIDFKIPGVTKKDKTEALELLKKYMFVTSDLNVRTLKSLLVTKKMAEMEGSDWKKDAKAHLLSKSIISDSKLALSPDEFNALRETSPDLVKSFEERTMVDSKGDEEKIYLLK